jgi:DNA-binding transcriptional LysR family regulator
MELRQVRYFVAIAENLKGVRQTSKHLHVSRPSLSVTISSMFARAYVQEDFAVIHELQDVVV